MSTRLHPFSTDMDSGRIGIHTYETLFKTAIKKRDRGHRYLPDYFTVDGYKKIKEEYLRE